MKRPMVIAGFTLLLAMMLCMILGLTFAWIAGCSGLMLLFLLLYIQKRQPNRHKTMGVPFCCLFLVIGCFVFSLYNAIYIAPLTQYDNTTQTLPVVITKQGETYQQASYYTAKTYGLYKQSQRPVTIRLRSTHHLQAGEIIEATLTLSLPPEEDRTAQYSNGIYLYGELLQYTSTETQHAYYTWIPTINQSIQQTFSQGGDVQANSLITAITLGDVRGMIDQHKADFRNAGMWHLVAVSGTHTSTISNIFIILLVLLGTGRRWQWSISLFFVWAFTLISGSSFSFLRAAIMCSVYAGGRFIYKQSDPLNQLGLSVAVIVLLFPLSIGNLGFLASVCACVGILLFTNPLRRLVSFSCPVLQLLWTSLCLSVSACFAIIPCNILAFYQYSLASPFANLIGVPLSGGILCFGLATYILSLFSGTALLSRFTLYIAQWLAKLLLKTAKWFGKPTGLILQQSTFWCFCAFLLVCILLLIAYRYRKRLCSKSRRILVYIMILLVIGSSLLPAYLPNAGELICVGDAYGVSLLLISNQQTIVINCHNSFTVGQLLRSRGVVQIDLLVLPEQPQNLSAVYSLSQQLPIHTVLAKEETVASLPTIASVCLYSHLAKPHQLPLDSWQWNTALTHLTFRWQNKQICYTHKTAPFLYGEYTVICPSETGKNPYFAVASSAGVYPVTRATAVYVHNQTSRIYFPKELI